MDKKPEKLVPEVRFKGFTDDWEQRKFDNVVKRINDKDDNPELPHIEFENIISGNGTLNKNIKDLNSKKIGTKFQKEDILFGKLRPYLKNWYFAKENGIAVGDFWVLRAKKISVFVYYLIQTEKFYSIANLSSGSKMPRSDWNLVSNSRFNFPENTIESIKIGNLILQLDKLITLQQRKLEQLKRLKKAMLQQLFANNNSKQPNLRFKNFKGDWEQCKLGELIESLFQGINTAADKVEYSNNGLPIIQAKNITSGSLDFSGSRKLSVQKYSNYLDKYIPQKGDILFANIGTIGPNVILKDTRQFFIAWNILRIVPQKNINGEFLKITLDLLNSKHYFEKLLTGNATKFVNKNDMRNLPIFFSDPEEQNKISNLFKKLDFLITLQQNKLTQLTTLKKYLLQKMFI